MAGRIVLFGATGYTGRLTADALARRGVKPVLAARSAEALDALASELGGGYETAMADVSRPETVRALVERGDVLLSTVGPFMRFGDPAVRAAIDAGAHYLDSTGEGPFIRRVFEEFGPQAERAEVVLLTAMGYDWVPGNLAGGLALQEAGEAATALDVGYFILGAASMSGGTRASAAGALLDDTYAFRGGRIVTERGGARVRSFDVNGRSLQALTVGATEAFSLPRVHPTLRDVDTYLGWFGPATRAVAAFALVARAPGARTAIGTLAERFMKGSSGGPDAATRARSRSHVVAVARNSAQAPLATVHLEGANGYDFTGDMLAWASERMREGALRGAGALGPVEAFGLDPLREGAAEAGITRV
ncbi:MAG TPA: saccharopine dehydrogenase NADP-binding domain-containing protein [Solirubrobacteraceae bacterium]